MAQKKKNYWLGFDLGGTKMYAALFDERSKKTAEIRKRTKGRDGVEAGLTRMVEMVRELCEESHLNMAQISGMGICCPGPLNLETGVLVEAANLGWSNVPIKSYFEKNLGIPVAIGNDVDIGVLGEYYMGAGKNHRCVLGVFPGTGIGAGCVYEGKILRGKTKSCLEMGHIQVQPNGPLCGCGKYGCLEAVASRLAIAAEAAKAAFRGQAPHLLANTKLKLSEIRSGALKSAIEAGDSVVEQVVRDGARWLGTGVAVMVNILAPDVIVLGGGLVEALPEIFLKEVAETARNRCMPAFAASINVKISQLGDDAGVIGAALLARDAAKT
ncbi:MAG: ROK family protein [Kiritimatiellae bacterium]|nr:ROK family protein [Kiritimatiellia bacterium]